MTRSINTADGLSSAIELQDAAASKIGGARPSVLFANQTSQLGGAEHILLSILQDFGAESVVWLFEDGPIHSIVLAPDSVILKLDRHAVELSAIRCDRSLLIAALPLVRHMTGVLLGIAAAARRFDLVYANSQKRLCWP